MENTCLTEQFSCFLKDAVLGVLYFGCYNYFFECHIGLKAGRKEFAVLPGFSRSDLVVEFEDADKHQHRRQTVLRRELNPTWYRSQ